MQKKKSAALIISILLALIVKAGLEKFFEPIFEHNEVWASVSGLHCAQGFLFFLLVLRFYLGAIRYIDTEYRNLPLFITCINLSFAFLLFGGFFVIALAIRDSDKFFLLILAVHFIDIGWFLTGRFFSRNLSNKDLHVGEIRIEEMRTIMDTFLVFSIVTVAFTFFSYWVTSSSIFDPNPNGGHWLYLSFLVTISFFDLYWFGEYYFNSVRWIEKHAIKKRHRTPQRS